MEWRGAGFMEYMKRRNLNWDYVKLEVWQGGMYLTVD